MRKNDVVTLESSGKTARLLRSIGRKDEGGQFWELEFEDGSKDIMLLRERKESVAKKTTKEENKHVR